MGIYVKHYVEHNHLLVLLHGVVTDADLDAHITYLFQSEFDQVGKNSFIVLCDELVTSEVSYRAITSAAKRMHKSKFRQGGKVAIITKTAVAFGLAKIYQLVTEVPDLDEIRVFRKNKFDVAIEWVDMFDLCDEIQTKICELEGIDTEVKMASRA